MIRKNLLQILCVIIMIGGAVATTNALAEDRGEDLSIVYVFNVSSKAMVAFAPNGISAGAVDNWNSPNEKNPFTPAQLAVKLDNDSTAGRFALGDNRVLFRTSEVFNFQVIIPDFGKWILYVSQTSWTLYTADGKLDSQGSVRIGSAFGAAL